MFKKLRKNEKGFTLAELLIVVAIIGVLVAISIPIFTSQLEKAREATDMANIRSAYAEVAAAALTDSDTTITETVAAKQTQTGWQTDNNTEIAGIKLSDIAENAKKGGTFTIKYEAGTDGTGKITIDGKEAKSSFKSTTTTGSGT